VYGTGAVGGVIGGHLHVSGLPTTLVARGQHLSRLQQNGLVLDTAESRVTVDAPAPEDVPVVSVQNGVDNEPTILRHFERAYSASVLLPAAHVEPGVVVQQCWPTPGILDVGRYPSGIDELSQQLSADLTQVGFSSRPQRDIMAWKYRKLVVNLANGVVAGPADRETMLSTSSSTERGTKAKPSSQPRGSPLSPPASTPLAEATSCKDDLELQAPGRLLPSRRSRTGQDACSWAAYEGR